MLAAEKPSDLLDDKRRTYPISYIQNMSRSPKSAPASSTSSPATPNNANSKNPLKGAVEILPDRLYFCAFKSAPPSNPKLLLRSPNDQSKKLSTFFFSIDTELIYWNFFLDFGPLNLGQLKRFCNKLNLYMDKYETICFYSSANPAKRANGIFLICAWQMLHMGRSPEEAFAGFDSSLRPAPSTVGFSQPPPTPLSKIGTATVAPLPPFHDASPCVCTYNLSILDCLKGMQKAQMYGFFDWNTFNVEEYEHFEQVENGDLNWIIKDRILAFAGPSFKKTISPEGYCTLAPSDYIPYFKQKNVGLVVRLNKRLYNEKDFTKAGIRHAEHFYLDGSCPPMKILQAVVAAFETVPPDQAFAVHCKAGLGRTGTCIGAYMMKHYRLTAAEAIGWMRICRPGMVIGPQQQFLEDIQPIMWQQGDLMRADPRSNMVPLQTPAPSTPNRGRANNNTAAVPITPLAATNTPTRSSEDADMRDEAVRGRAGQADGLLAARRGAKQAPPLVTPDGKNSDDNAVSGYRSFFGSNKS